MQGLVSFRPTYHSHEQEEHIAIKRSRQLIMFAISNLWYLVKKNNPYIANVINCDT